MFARVHQTKSNIVSAHKHGQRIFVSDVDWKRGVPPRGVIKRNFWRILYSDRTLAHVVFATECLQRIDRTPRILRTCLKLQPRTLFRQHCSVHTKFGIFGEGKQRHRAHNRFWLERDVVVHEQHVSCPARFTKFDQAARKTAGATQIAVWDYRERGI